MLRRHHEIPTHLNVEDKLLFGLTVRQFLYVLVGTSLSYGAWNQLVDAPPALRFAVVGLALIATACHVLLRPLGRPLEEWLLAACSYAATPRRATWRPTEPDPLDWRPPAGAWRELAPSLTWAGEDDAGSDLKSEEAR
jgi:hypothetical protein